MDNGLIKSITEQYLVNSMSFTECEARVLSEQGEGVREVTCQAIARSNIKEVVFYGDTDLWFKVKVCYNLMDEDTEKEKKISTYILVNANDAREAYDRCAEHLKEMLVPFQIPKVEETNFVDVYDYQQSLRPRASDTVATDLKSEATAKADKIIESKIGAADPTNGQAHGFSMVDEAEKLYMGLPESQRGAIAEKFLNCGPSHLFIEWLTSFIGCSLDTATSISELLANDEDDAEQDGEEEECVMDAVAVDIEATNLIGALSPSERKTLMIVHGCAESESVFAERNGWTPQQLRKVIDHLDNMDAFDADEEDGGTDLESRLDRAFAAQTEID